jgi:hypothetical protein
MGFGYNEGQRAFNKHKQPSKEMEEIFRKNGTLADYVKSNKKKKSERRKEEDISKVFYNFLSW